MPTRHFVKVQTVTELTRSIRGLLETEFPFVSVAGEISNLRQPQSGHLYFTLKDREAQIRAVLFKTQQRYLAVSPADGLAVICRGRLSLYEARGEYQLLIDTLETKGAGDLRGEFEQLKNRLAAEGLFAPERKRPLPLLPQRVALVTSSEGAAVHDFIRTAARRFPGLPLEIFPVRVQGEAAPDEIAEALRSLNQRGSSEVIVLCRGGGSLEDLWAFNSEKVARAIFTSAIPVVSAVGHEIDFTIADFVADYRAATPTAAAEAVIPDRLGLLARVARADQGLLSTLSERLSTWRYRTVSQKRLLGDPSLLLHNSRLRLGQARLDLATKLATGITLQARKVDGLRNRLLELSPDKQLAVKAQREGELERRLRFAMTLIIRQNRLKLGEKSSLLDSVSPLAVLARGYSLTRRLPERTVVRNSEEVAIGGRLEIILRHGTVETEVTKIFSATEEKRAGEVDNQ
jgi:exodeoxyribonuclease VII large subunit